MQVQIISLEGVRFDGPAAGVNVKTTSGEITVLDHHLPLISVLQPGQAHVILADKTRKTFTLAGGFLEMNAHNKLTILAD